MKTKVLRISVLFVLIFFEIIFFDRAAETYPIIRPKSVADAPIQDPIGIVKIAPNEPVHIVCWFIFGGINYNLSINLKCGVEMAIDDKKMRLLDHPIRLTIQNTDCSEGGGRNAAIKIATDPSVIAAIGPICSNEAKAGAPILWRAGLCTVSPSDTAPDMTDLTRGSDFSGYLRTSYNDNLQGSVAAQFAYNQLKFRKGATISDGSLYSSILESTFIEAYKWLGGIITTQEKVNSDQTNIKSILSKIALENPEVLYLPTSLDISSRIVNQARQIAGLEKTTIITTAESFDIKFYQAAEKNAIGIYHTAPDFGKNFDLKLIDFEKKYQEKYNQAPISNFHAHSYDAAMMIFAAIERVAKKESDGTLYIGRNALRNALFATQDFDGLTGKLTCNSRGDCGYPIIAIFKSNEENIINMELPKKPYWTPME